MKAVFISHASKSFRIADELRKLLEERSIPCWIAPRDIPAGSSYGEEIVRGIGQCKVTVLLLTEEANLSRAVANEIELSFNRQNVIVPVRLNAIRPSAGLEFYISNAQWVDACVSPLKRRVDEIVRIVQAVQDGKVPQPAAPEKKSLLASAERFLEQLLRYKLLTAVAAFLILAAMMFSVTHRMDERLHAEQSAIAQDPASYGLIRVSELPDGSSLSKPGQIALWTTVQSGLRAADPSQVKLAAVAIGEHGKAMPLDLAGSLSADWLLNSQALTLMVPSDTRRVVFCFTAPHPTLKRMHTARWSYQLTVSGDALQIARDRAPSLVSDIGGQCDE